MNDLDHPAPFRYLRLRRAAVRRGRARRAGGAVRRLAEPVYVYFRHEDEPTAPRYAQRLVELLA